MSDGALRLRDVTLAARRETPLLSDFSLDVEPSEIVTLMGPSGVGKSTLLAFVCGTLSPDFSARGRVFIGSRELTGLPPEQRAIGTLFQDDLLFPHLSVIDNLLFALPRSVRGSRRRRDTAAAALRDAGLNGFDGRDPATLSGGQRARVALLRTLLSRPRALLLDEPFSKLDDRTRGRFRRQVFDHARAAALPTLLVTHDPADAAGRIVDLTD